MVQAIVYNSNTGFTKQYAYSFAVKTGLKIYSLKEINKLPKGINIIFFSWVRASKIVKLDKLKNHTIEMVCAVGIQEYQEEYIEALKKENKLNEIYYLQGGLRYYKLNLFYRFIFKMLKKSLNKKKKKNAITNTEENLLKILQEGKEMIELSALDSLLNWYSCTLEDMVC